MPHGIPSADQLYAVIYYLIYGWKDLPPRMKRRLLLRLAHPIQGYQQLVQLHQLHFANANPSLVVTISNNIKTFYREYLIKIMQSISNAHLYTRSFHEFACEIDFIARRESEKIEKLIDDCEKSVV
jgi:hypothetical protein